MASEIYLLNLRTDERKEAFSDVAGEYGSFSEAVPQFRIAKGRKIVVLVSLENQMITHISYGVKGNPVATRLHNLKLTNVECLKHPIEFENIVSRLRPNVRNSVMEALNRGTKLPPKTRNYAIKIIREENPSVDKFLQHFSEKRKKFINGLEGNAKENFSFQRDAICMALQLGGMPRELSTQWNAPEDERKSLGSILELFPEGDISDGDPSEDDLFEDDLIEEEPVAGEDLKIMTDWSRVPGFDESIVEQEHFAIRRFLSRKKPDQQLTVIMANRETLEQQTGTDLIYRNDTDKNFVMVQYKSTNSRYKGKKVFRWNDTSKLMEQVDRMDKILEILNNHPVSPDSENYRFTENPFFLKICKQTEVKPDDTGMATGMYLPLEYWKRGCDDGRFCGENGGKYVGEDNVGRYIVDRK